MAKRRQKRGRREPLATAEYKDAEGNTLVLRQELSVGTVAKIREAAKPGASYEDAWQRRQEMLFERLAVSWEIAGLPLTEQAMLLGRYRMADRETRDWVGRCIATHLERYMPELGGGGV
jgi:hypothetical protein